MKNDTCHTAFISEVVKAIELQKTSEITDETFENNVHINVTSCIQTIIKK